MENNEQYLLHRIHVKAFELEDCEFVPVHHQQNYLLQRDIKGRLTVTWLHQSVFEVLLQHLRSR